MDAKQRPTIYDIASKADVSISTVSRVFNNNPSVSGKTRTKVERAIQELNYIPNAIARSLVSKHSKTIGLIVSDISNPFFTGVIDGIEHIVSKEGYYTFHCDTRYDLAREKKYINRMLEKRVDGIITFSTYDSTYDLIKNAKMMVPFVSIQSQFGDTDSVNTYDAKGAYKAVDHLIQLGHKKIALIVYDYNNLTVTSRIKGYMYAHINNKLPYNKDYIFKMKYCADAGYHMTNEILDKHPEITAIFAYNDKLAVSSYMAIQARGLKIPDDISIVGYDDTKIASIVTPKLTTVSQPMYEMGVNAAELLLKRIKGQDNPILPKLVLLPAKLKIRNSTKRI